MNPYIRILLLGSYVWFFGEGLLGPLYAVFAERVGGDVLDLTGAYALYLFCAGAFSILIGAVSDHRQSKKALMIAGYALNALATFGYLLVDRPWELFVVQALLGVANALATPTWNALFSKHADRDALGMEWGYSDGGPKVIMAIAALAGGALVTVMGFRALFMIMGGVQVIATIVQAWVFRVSAVPAREIARH